MKTNGNDPTYPTLEEGTNNVGLPAWFTTPGLNKREYFAIMALQGMLADGTSESHLYDYATRAVYAADYLIEALNK